MNVCVQLYRYEFTGFADKGDAWWRRRRVRSYLAAIDADNPRVEQFLQRFDWID